MMLMVYNDWRSNDWGIPELKSYLLASCDKRYKYGRMSIFSDTSNISTPYCYNKSPTEYLKLQHLYSKYLKSEYLKSATTRITLTTTRGVYSPSLLCPHVNLFILVLRQKSKMSEEDEVAHL